jgi:methylenetetrahydrofolate reductase (NADPH)
LSGCRNILALRGDPPAGKDDWEAVEGGFEHGVDLVRYIRKEYGDYFDIAVAGYPQTQMLPPEERAQEMTWLKEKVDAGANLIFTQMFYDADMFIDWVHTARAAGITVPIIPGIMPIQTWNGFLRAATAIAKTIIPQSYLDALEPYKNDDEKVREIGTKLVADMCRKILAAPLGIQGLHFYTMNLERGTRLLLEELSLVPRIETIKPLPWRQVSPSFRASLYSYLFDFIYLVSYACEAVGNHSPHLLGESYKVLPLPHRRLGRVSQRSIWGLAQRRLWGARWLRHLTQTIGMTL